MANDQVWEGRVVGRRDFIHSRSCASGFLDFQQKTFLWNSLIKGGRVSRKWLYLESFMSSTACSQVIYALISKWANLEVYQIKFARSGDQLLHDVSLQPLPLRDRLLYPSSNLFSRPFIRSLLRHFLRLRSWRWTAARAGAILYWWRMGDWGLVTKLRGGGRGRKTRNHSPTPSPFPVQFMHICVIFNLCSPICHEFSALSGNPGYQLKKYPRMRADGHFRLTFRRCHRDLVD